MAPITLLTAAAISFLIGLWRPSLAFPVALIGCGIALAATGWGLIITLQDGPLFYTFGGWPRPLGIEYVMDPLSSIMAVLVTFFGFVVIFYGHRPVARTFRSKTGYFYTLMLLLLAGLSGIALTGDVFNLFVFLEISSLSTYALIATGGRQGTVAAFRYLILGTTGASLYLLGIGFIFLETGTLNMAHLTELLPQLYDERSILVGLALVLTGLALKTAVFPLHFWLPDAYTHAPPTVSALMAAISTKVSAYAIIRILFWVFDSNYVAEQVPFTRWIVWLSLAGILIASFQAMPQTQFRRLLAFSSISQIGFIGLGIGLANSLGLIAAVLHIVNHAVMKACLFLAAGYIHYRLGKERVTDLAGVGSQMPWIGGSIVIAGLSLVGIPPTGGFFSKWYLIQGAIARQEWLSLAVILVGSLLTAAYVLRLLRHLFLTRPPQPVTPIHRQKDLWMVVPTVFLAIGTVALGLTNAYLVDGVIRATLPSHWQ